MARSVWVEEGFIGGDKGGHAAPDEVQLSGGRLLRRKVGRPGASGQAGPPGWRAGGERDLRSLLGPPEGVGWCGKWLRAAMQAAPQRFGSLAEALAEMEKRIKTPVGQWRREAQLLARPVQRSLMDF